MRRQVTDKCKEPWKDLPPITALNCLVHESPSPSFCLQAAFLALFSSYFVPLLEFPPPFSFGIMRFTSLLTKSVMDRLRSYGGQ